VLFVPFVAEIIPWDYSEVSINNYAFCGKKTIGVIWDTSREKKEEKCYRPVCNPHPEAEQNP
jgi:hypothetical protein